MRLNLLLVNLRIVQDAADEFLSCLGYVCRGFVLYAAFSSCAAAEGRQAHLLTRNQVRKARWLLVRQQHTIVKEQYTA
jgi:hypothetical protein